MVPKPEQSSSMVCVTRLGPRKTKSQHTLSKNRKKWQALNCPSSSLRETFFAPQLGFTHAGELGKAEVAYSIVYLFWPLSLRGMRVNRG